MKHVCIGSENALIYFNQMIQTTRVEQINSIPAKKGQFVVYWMQQAQRARYNHALEYAIECANERNLPLVVIFNLTKYPEANRRHYFFLLQGLQHTQKELQSRGIKMVVAISNPEKSVVKIADTASMVITDMGYLRIQRAWRKAVAEKITCPLIQVESDVIVPIRDVSPKEEFSAGTLRPKITRKLGEYLVPLRERNLNKKSTGMKLETCDISNIEQVLKSLKTDSSVREVSWLEGGTSYAEGLLSEFIISKLDFFASSRNDPSLNYSSNLSPYFHFGQISPLYVALEIAKTRSPGRDAFLEEMIVRRELSMNYVWYNSHYDSYQGLPEWARKTLDAHKKEIGRAHV